MTARFGIWALAVSALVTSTGVAAADNQSAPRMLQDGIDYTPLIVAQAAETERRRAAVAKQASLLKIVPLGTLIAERVGRHPDAALSLIDAVEAAAAALGEGRDPLGDVALVLGDEAGGADGFAIVPLDGFRDANEANASCGAQASADAAAKEEGVRSLLASGRGASLSLDEAVTTCTAAQFSLNAERPVDDQDFSVRLSPELGRCPDGACSLRGVKGEIRLGESGIAPGGEKRGWYVYAGADGTLVVWDERPSSLSRLADTVDVRDTLTMGDIEAGVMLSRGPADLSLSFVHRRSQFETWDETVVDNEDFVGIKLSFDGDR